MQVSKEGIERLRASNPLSAVLAERGYELRRKGQTLVCRCMFHSPDKTPSFCVTPGKELFHCFGCGVSGDVIGFLVKKDGLTFPQVLEALARRANLDPKTLMEPAQKAPGRTPTWALTPRGPESEAATSRRVPTPAKAAKAKPATPAKGARSSSSGDDDPEDDPPSGSRLVPPEVVEHYHRTFCERKDAQAYLIKKRGLADLDLLRALKVGYADGSLLERLPKKGELRDRLTELGIITKENKELLGGCVVVPIPDPLTGTWTNLYGRGVRTPRHCYLPGPMRGVVNFQAARLSSEVVLTESILDALSFHQAGISIAIPIHGTNGFTGEHMDLLKRERVERVILALDNDAAGRRATDSLKEKLTAAGLAVRVARFPADVKDANELLVSRNGDASEAFRQVLDEAEPKPKRAPAPASPEPKPAAQAPTLEEPESLEATVQSEQPAPELESASLPPAPVAASNASTVTTPSEPQAPRTSPATSTTTLQRNAPPSSPLSEKPAQTAAAPTRITDRTLGREGDDITLRRLSLSYRMTVHGPTLGRLRATIKLLHPGGSGTFIDSLDLYSSKSRADFARKAVRLTNSDPEHIENDLLALLAEAEKQQAQEEHQDSDKPKAPEMTELERQEAMAFLLGKGQSLLEQIKQDVDLLGFVGEEHNVVLLYLIAVSRKTGSPLSAVIFSQSGAGKSGITEVIEAITAPEDVLLITRLTPQSMYYMTSEALDRKLVIIEERNGSTEADYSIRVLQSRGRLIAVAPVKDPQTGTMRTQKFEVEAKAAFIEATTATSVNNENATRCFELIMDESIEQTRRIQQRQRLMKTEAGLALRQQAEAIKRKHWNAQRLLQPLPVVIPFAEAIEFPDRWMRARRDNARFLNLIEVSAFLHQYQRERKDGAIVAGIADYAVAYRLARTVLEGTLADLKLALKDAYAKIRTLFEEKAALTRREIREALGVPDGTLRHWLAELVQLEYLSASEGGGHGNTMRYQLAEASKEPVSLGLLTPDELKKKLGR